MESRKIVVDGREITVTLCRDCKNAEFEPNAKNFIAPYWCHEAGEMRAAIDFCSFGEPT